MGSSLWDRLSPAVCEGIFFIFQENQSLLLADPASDAWKVYLDYVDEIVLDGFFTAIECSLKYLLENTGDTWFLSPELLSLSKGTSLVVLPHAQWWFLFFLAFLRHWSLQKGRVTPSLVMDCSGGGMEVPVLCLQGLMPRDS